MALRSALYYPHTDVKTPTLLKTALLLWDQITVLVPATAYKPQYDSLQLQEAFELVGKCHYPTDTEKTETHDLVEDFLTRPLPHQFFLTDAMTDETYEIYTEKLLPETWRLLHDYGMVHAGTQRSDYAVAHATGLVIMNLLADCCAGDAMMRVTDRLGAYRRVASLLTESFDAPTQSVDKADANTREILIRKSVSIVDAGPLELERLIDFRRREIASPQGHQIRDLRHRYVEKLEAYVAATSNLEGADAKERLAQFERDISDDIAALKHELKLAAGWDFVSTQMSALGLASLSGVGVPVATAIGALATACKFAQTRRDILQKHSTAYLYELRDQPFKW